MRGGAEPTGPHKHAIQQTFSLYAWEPDLNRIEIGTAGARLVLAPDDWLPRTARDPSVSARAVEAAARALT